MAHQAQVGIISDTISAAVFNAALGADPAAVSTWFMNVGQGLLMKISQGYAVNRNSAMSYLTRHAALNNAAVTPMPGSLDVAALHERLRITGPVAFKTAIDAGHDTDYALRSMATQMSGVADEIVRNGDRDVITETARRGRGVIGWRRRLSGHACGFCSMLASRGSVYISRKVATISVKAEPYHPHCHCWAEPLYDRQEEPAYVRQLQGQWRRVTAGHSGKDAQRVWRQHWEQRVTSQARIRYNIPSPGAGAGVPISPVEVRPLLLAAQTPADVGRVLEDEYARLTGRTLAADFAGSVRTAREHAEGILRAVEQHPDIRIDSVRTGDTVRREAYAHTNRDTHEIVFSERFSSVPNRDMYLSRIAEDEQVGFHPKGTGNAAGIAEHEAGHLFDPEFPFIDDQIDAMLFELSAAEGRPITRAIIDDISRYASRSHREMVAEAFADVTANGASASALSRRIVDIVARGKLVPEGAEASFRFGVLESRAAGMTPAEFEARVSTAAKGEEVSSRVPINPNTETLTEAQRSALVQAGGTGFEDYGAVLRGGRSPFGTSRREIDKQVAALDRLMRESRLQSDAVLWRGSRTGRGVFGRKLSGDLTGFEWTEESYISTSANREVAELFGALGEAGPDVPGVLMRILAPEGVGAVELYGGESEVLLQRGLRLRVVEDHGISQVTPRNTFGMVVGQPHPVRILDVEVVPTRLLATEARPRTVAELRAVVAEHRITVPTGLGKPALERLVADLERGVAPATARETAVQAARAVKATPAKAAKKAAPAKKALRPAQPRFAGAHNPDAAAAVAEAVGATDLAAIRETLRPYNLRQLRAVATEARIDIPATDAQGLPWTEDDLRTYVAKRIERDRGRYQWRGSEYLGPSGPGPAPNPSPIDTVSVNAARKIQAKRAREAARAERAAALPVPARMTIPALKTELQPIIDAAPDISRFELAGVPKDTLAHWVERARSLPASERNLEVGRWQQVIVDKRRALVDALVEADELVANGASARALESRALARLRSAEASLQGWPELAEIRKLTTAMQTGDPVKIRRAIKASGKKLGLQQIGADAGQVSRFERGTMSTLGGKPIPDGAHVVVIRPGYSVEIGGRRIVMSRPVVREASPDEIPQPKSVKAPTRRRLTANQVRDLAVQSPQDLLQAVRDGSVTGRAAAQALRNEANYHGRMAAAMGADSPISESLPAVAANRAKAAELRALADEAERIRPVTATRGSASSQAIRTPAKKTAAPVKASAKTTGSKRLTPLQIREMAVTNPEDLIRAASEGQVSRSAAAEAVRREANTLASWEAAMEGTGSGGLRAAKVARLRAIADEIDRLPAPRAAKRVPAKKTTPRRMAT